jgi:hypothetical protein
VTTKEFKKGRVPKNVLPNGLEIRVFYSVFSVRYLLSILGKRLLQDSQYSKRRTGKISQPKTARTCQQEEDSRDYP